MPEIVINVDLFTDLFVTAIDHLFRKYVNFVVWVTNFCVHCSIITATGRCVLKWQHGFIAILLNGSWLAVNFRGA